MMKSHDSFPPSTAEEIMARYRPIAPKPPLRSSSLLFETPPAAPFSHPANFFRSHARLAGSRKRPRGASPGAASRNIRTGFPPTTHRVHISEILGNHITSPLVPASCHVSHPGIETATRCSKILGLNQNPRPEIIEMDLLQKLQAPWSGSKRPDHGTLKIPRPVRPIGSTIAVSHITQVTDLALSPPVVRTQEEVEEELEIEASPSIITDSNNKVRLVNTAYNEMVGQPDCAWLDSVASSTKLSGAVLLDSSHAPVPVTAKSFSCRVKIEWARGEVKAVVDAGCDVSRVSCASEDYMFVWRFRADVPE